MSLEKWYWCSLSVEIHRVRRYLELHVLILTYSWFCLERSHPFQKMGFLVSVHEIIVGKVFNFHDLLKKQDTCGVGIKRNVKKLKSHPLKLT